MTKLELIEAGKHCYAELEEQIPNMEGLQKLVAQELGLRWIKGVDWRGGLSDAVFTKVYESKFAPLGYSVEEIDNAFYEFIDYFTSNISQGIYLK